MVSSTGIKFFEKYTYFCINMQNNWNGECIWNGIKCENCTQEKCLLKYVYLKIINKEICVFMLVGM